MGNFYAKLAFQNVKRSRNVYLPYLLATAIISGVFFLILAMLYSDTISGVPGGGTAQMMMMMGVFVFTLFAFCFMLYVNNFLVQRRKKEFGLYAVLGMNKSQVAHILRNEGLIVIGSGVLLGMALGAVFGRLLFMLLMSLIHAAPNSEFTLPGIAFIGTLGLFAVVYIVTAVWNSIVVAKTGTSELLTSDRSGEKDPKLVIPLTILGILMLGAAYAVAILSQAETAFAIGCFFPAVFLVIIATYILFKTGSIAVLRALKKNKKLYYKTDNFIAISGMFHRMRQNARGLATICILFTMLLVTVAGCASLFLGQEEILGIRYPMNACTTLYHRGDSEEPFYAKLDYTEFDKAIGEAGKAAGLTLSYDKSKLCYDSDTNDPFYVRMATGIPVDSPEDVVEFDNFIRVGRRLYFNVSGDDEKAQEFFKEGGVYEKIVAKEFAGYSFTIEDIYSQRIEAYGLFGGLLFIGAFFAILFLVGTVLIIYFKQITEGYEDKERFAIMQKVGMDDAEVRRTIKKQIIWVFFLPLFAAIMHIGFASGMIAKMLEVFSLYNAGLTFMSVGVTCVVFGIVYLVVYLQTAKTYYKIVRR